MGVNDWSLFSGEIDIYKSVRSSEDSEYGKYVNYNKSFLTSRF